MSGGRMGGDGLLTGADARAMRAWMDLGSFNLPGGEQADRTYSDGRMFIPVPGPEAAREVEVSMRAREERHAEGRVRLMRAVGGALGLSHAAGAGPWASGNPGTEKGREELRRAGFEERHDAQRGTTWVRPADGETLAPGEPGAAAPREDDVGRGRSG